MFVDLKNKEYITSYNFARISDKVYAESLTSDQYELLKNENTKIISKSENQVLYINTKFKINENDIIFCNSYMIDSLFNILNNVKNLKNLKLITSQTDHLINKNLFKTKPSCISQWYSTNVGYNDKNLIPIPLGLANDYSTKNLKTTDFMNKNKEHEKKTNIYSNFQINTNYRHRKQVLKNLMKNNNVIFVEPNLEISEYFDNLNEYLFIVCPWGNGFDSHRIWETLYSDSIPIVFDHLTFSTLDDLPKIKISNLKQLNDDNLFDNFKKEKFIYEKLNIAWWEALIKSKKVDNGNSFDFDNSRDYQIIRKNYKAKLKKEHNQKFFKTLFRKIDKRINQYV